MNENMYRYLENYVGKYRVIARYDYRTQDFPRDHSGEIDESFEDLYIPCSKGNGEIRHTYKPGMLAFYTEKQSTAKSIVKKLSEKKNHPDFDYDDHYDNEAIITFYAKDIDYFAKVFGAKKTGKDIPPFSNTNLPAVEYKLPKEATKEYKELISKIPAAKRDNFAKLIIDDFDCKIEFYKGKKFNFRDKRDKSNLDNLTFIHYVGLWEKFIRYARKRIKQEFTISL